MWTNKKNVATHYVFVDLLILIQVANVDNMKNLSSIYKR